jgi:hypothetical protein
VVAASVYLGLIVAEPSIERKIREKHQITLAEVREALQWPARAETVEEDHPRHGHRWIATGSCADGREVIACLLPLPPYLGPLADTWTLKTARWLKDD